MPQSGAVVKLSATITRGCCHVVRPAGVVGENGCRVVGHDYSWLLSRCRMIA
jgi:hypothetical protein